MSLVTNLIKQYDDFSVHIPYWEIADHGITVLWGPSGAGKTTCFRILLGLESCPGLSWNFKGIDLATVSPGERRLGVVFQELNLFSHMTVFENILFAAKARKIFAADQKIREVSQRLQIEALLNKNVGRLSGGEKQRVAIARAIVGEPRFLFLDEPFSALDIGLRRTAHELLQEVVSQYAIPTMLITHDLEDVESLANVVVEIQAGRLMKTEIRDSTHGQPS